MSEYNRSILLIDRNVRNMELLGDFLVNQGFESITLSDLTEFTTILTDYPGIGLALVDISGFDRSIWDKCQLLSDYNIPFIVISPKQVATIREEGRAHGAKDVLLKPLVAQELVILIKSLMNTE